MIGNSLTNNSIPALLPNFFKRDLIPFFVGVTIGSGTSLTQTFANTTSWQTAFAANKYDYVTLQPYPGASSLLSEQQAIAGFVNAALDGPSIDPVFYIYEGWPQISTTAGNYQAYWDSAVSNADNTTMIIKRAAFDHLLDRARTNINPNFWIIPTGGVVREIDVQARAGNLPGLATADDIHVDDSHMGDIGRFAAAVTVYSVLQKKKMTDQTQWHNYTSGSGVVPLTQQLADSIVDIVWGVVSNDPRTGIGQ